jgi:hypothetical protein
MTPGTSDQLIGRPLPTQNTNTYTKTPIPRIEFEPTILASKRDKIVHALDHSATVNGIRKDTTTNDQHKSHNDEYHIYYRPLSCISGNRNVSSVCVVMGYEVDS